MKLRAGFATTLQQPVFRALLALVLMVLIGMVFNANGAFFKPGTHFDTLRYISRYGILACGMTLVIIAGGIDLAVGSVLGLSAVCFALFTIHLGWGAVSAFAACIGIGLAAGLTSGVLAGKFRIQPFVATLAMMVFARGLAKMVSGGQKVSTAIQKADGAFEYVNPPAIFGRLSGKVFNDTLPVILLVLLAAASTCWLLLRRLRWGRHLYAIGGNEEAARLSGIPIVASKMLAYGLCGALAAVAGVCQAAEEIQGDPEAGQSYELTTIAIVVIGGTSLAGGRGGIMLTLFGTLTIGYLEKILSLNAVAESSRLMLTGLIIVCAVLFQRTRR
jgi:ribose transport system permease protein